MADFTTFLCKQTDYLPAKYVWTCLEFQHTHGNFIMCMYKRPDDWLMHLTIDAYFDSGVYVCCVSCM